LLQQIIYANEKLKNIIMLLSFFKKVRARIKAGAKSKQGKILALFTRPEPEAPENCPTMNYSLALGARCAMNEISWWRLMCSNIPVFSLFNIPVFSVFYVRS
jgi:hypothetical protein